MSDLPASSGLPALMRPMDNSLGRPRISGHRIAFVIDRLAGRGGGAERVLTDVANAMATRGHLVEIITHERQEGAPAYPVKRGVLLTNLRPPRGLVRRVLDHFRYRLEWYGGDIAGIDRMAWLSSHGGFWRRLAPYLQATAPDVVVSFMPPAITALAHAGARMRLQGMTMPRLVASTHNAPEQDFHNLDRWGKGRLDRARRLAAMTEMNRIAVLLPQYRDWYPVEQQARITVLPNPIQPVGEEARARPGVSRTIVAVGRLAEVKRPTLLLNVWARLAAEFPEWRLQFHGEGPLREDLQAMISTKGLEQSVKIMGQSLDMAKVYRDAACLAHPAAYEGFPLAVCEAQAAGLPVVGFADCSGLNALVRHDESGILITASVQDDDMTRSTNLENGLRTLMRDDVLRDRLGAAAPAIMEPYHPEVIYDAWENLLLGEDPR